MPKVCPFCKADIPDDARKCKHCGEWVTPVWSFRLSPSRGVGGPLLLLLLGAAFAALVTNPNEGAHRAVIDARTPLFRTQAALMNAINRLGGGGGIGLRYRNYFVFSQMLVTIDDGKTTVEFPISSGYFGTVHYLNDARLRRWEGPGAR